MKVKLAEGRALRDPTTHALMKPDEVREVPDTSMYWRRRLRDGDVIAADGGNDHSHAQHHRRAAAKED